MIFALIAIFVAGFVGVWAGRQSVWRRLDHGGWVIIKWNELKRREEDARLEGVDEYAASMRSKL